MTVTYSADAATGIAEIEVEGRVTRQDFEDIAPRLQNFIDQQGDIRLIEIVRSLQGFEPSLLWDGIRFDIKNLRHISHCAVVSDIGWLSPVTKAAGAVVSTKLRTFPMSELKTAQEWIRAPDGPAVA